MSSHVPALRERGKKASVSTALMKEACLRFICSNYQYSAGGGRQGE